MREKQLKKLTHYIYVVGEGDMLLGGHIPCPLYETLKGEGEAAEEINTLDLCCWICGYVCQNLKKEHLKPPHREGKAIKVYNLFQLIVY